MTKGLAIATALLLLPLLHACSSGSDGGSSIEPVAAPDPAANDVPSATRVLNGFLLVSRERFNSAGVLTNGTRYALGDDGDEILETRIPVSPSDELRIGPVTRLPLRPSGLPDRSVFRSGVDGDPPAVVERFRHDVAGRLVEHVASNPRVENRTTYTYDGERLARRVIRARDGRTIQDFVRVHDARGRLETIDYTSFLVVPPPRFLSTFTYEGDERLPSGRRTITIGDTSFESRDALTWDADGNLVAIESLGADGTVQARVVYTYERREQPVVNLALYRWHYFNNDV